jgi:hypothetical protein
MTKRWETRTTNGRVLSVYDDTKDGATVKLLGQMARGEAVGQIVWTELEATGPVIDERKAPGA